jgi:hypothetical protein
MSGIRLSVLVGRPDSQARMFGNTLHPALLPEVHGMGGNGSHV